MYRQQPAEPDLVPQALLHGSRSSEDNNSQMKRTDFAELAVQYVGGTVLQWFTAVSSQRGEGCGYVSPPGGAGGGGRGGGRLSFSAWSLHVLPCACAASLSPPARLPGEANRLL